jgi:hypothetical protein
MLCVHDGSDFQAVKVAGDQHVQQSALAVTPEGRVVGLLDQRWYRRVKTPAGETQAQRALRWRESDVWPEAVQAIGASPEACRLIHVADRAADDVRFMRACLGTRTGFVVRARFDRRVEEGTTHLWAHVSARPVAGTVAVEVGTQRNGRGKITRRGRKAVVELRHAAVQLERPSRDSQPEAAGRLSVQAVYLREGDPPDGVEGVDWMVLTGEKVENFQDACRIVTYYQARWVIEEWHRCLKEGCALEASQVDSVEDLERLAAVLSVVAVRMMHLRDLADPRHPENQADDPKTLRASVPKVWIRVVAGLFDDDPATLTPRQFWRNVARQGGWPARTSDGRPGWKVIWRGWYDVTQMVHGAELMSRRRSTRKKCG